MTADARTHLAWLIWCWTEGYTKAEDRAILTNWLLEDPAMLVPSDNALRLDLLAAADEVLAALSTPDEVDEHVSDPFNHVTSTPDEVDGGQHG